MENEITINGTVYIAKKKASRNYYIVRTNKAGVFAGEIKEKDLEKGIVTMNNARRLWYWDGAASLSQLAMEGVSKPENCQFPCEVNEVTLLGVVEIIPCTEIAEKSIEKVEIWKK